MVNSYAQTSTLKCPQCEHEFDVTVWLIIDTMLRNLTVGQEVSSIALTA